jgi:transposase
MARPTKLTDDIRDRLAALLRAGVGVDAAAEAVGIAPSTFRAWVQRGERDGPRDAPYRAFREVVERARGEHEAILVAAMSRAAGRGSWRAAAWVLEREFPERWGPPEHRAAAAPDGLEVPDELAALRKRAKGRRDAKHDPR